MWCFRSLAKPRILAQFSKPLGGIGAGHKGHDSESTGKGPTSRRLPAVLPMQVSCGMRAMSL